MMPLLDALVSRLGGLSRSTTAPVLGVDFPAVLGAETAVDLAAPTVPEEEATPDAHGLLPLVPTAPLLPSGVGRSEGTVDEQPTLTVATEQDLVPADPDDVPVVAQPLAAFVVSDTRRTARNTSKGNDGTSEALTASVEAAAPPSKAAPTPDAAVPMRPAEDSHPQAISRPHLNGGERPSSRPPSPTESTRLQDGLPSPPSASIEGAASVPTTDARPDLERVTDARMPPTSELTSPLPDQGQSLLRTRSVSERSAHEQANAVGLERAPAVPEPDAPTDPAPASRTEATTRAEAASRTGAPRPSLDLDSFDLGDETPLPEPDSPEGAPPPSADQPGARDAHADERRPSASAPLRPHAGPSPDSAEPQPLAPLVGDGEAPVAAASSDAVSAEAPPDLSAPQPPAADARVATPPAERTTTPLPTLPARLASAAWLGKLSTSAGTQGVQVTLGEDGTVRLQTQREGDGVTVSIRFSDPELQALAGAHAVRLRDALEAHFVEPVRLSLSDGLGADAGSSDGRAPGHAAPGRPSSPHGPHTTTDSALPATSHSAAVPGRREWIG